MDAYFHTADDVDDVHEDELGLLVVGGRRRRLGGGWSCASALAVRFGAGLAAGGALPAAALSRAERRPDMFCVFFDFSRGSGKVKTMA